MTDSDIRYYLTLAWRRLPYLVLSTAIGTALGIGAALLVVPTYRATTRILIESPAIPDQLARTTETSTASEQVQIIRERLTTRDSLLDLAERLGIYEGVEPAPPPADVIEDLRDRIRFDQYVLDSDGAGASIISISFDAPRPALAATVANSLAAQLLQKNTDARTSRAEETIRFFETERARLGDELLRVETDILDFKNANNDSLPDSLDFRRTQQTAAQEQFIQLTREEAMLHTRQINLGRFGSQLLAGSSQTPTSPARQMLLELERALVEQQAVYAADSPTVTGLKSRITDLEGRLRAEYASASPGEPSPDPAIELGRSDIQDRLKAIAEEKKQVVDQIDSLATSIAQTPASERTLNALMRDRDNLQLQYNAVVAKLGEALVGKQIEEGVGLDRISVVEDATPPARSIGPRRRLIAAGGLLLGGALGFAVLLIIELLNRSIRRPSEVTAVLEAPLLGTIPVLNKPRRRILPVPARSSVN